MCCCCSLLVVVIVMRVAGTLKSEVARQLALQVICDPPLTIPHLPQIKANREGGVARGADDDVGVAEVSGCVCACTQARVYVY